MTEGGGVNIAARRCAVLVVACLWAGFLAGVSFLATPVKFLAPSLSLPAALDVGRQTFHALNRCEIVLGVALLVLVLRAPRSILSRTLTAAALVIVLSQTFWLIPVLDARVGLILSGSMPAPSSLHTMYVGLEMAKLVALAGVAAIAAGRLLHEVGRANPGE